jgi:hypothetical protein
LFELLYLPKRETAVKVLIGIGKFFTQETAAAEKFLFSAKGAVFTLARRGEYP